MSNGQQIGSVVGGVVGAAIGVWAGVPSLGFSIGWMAGGWVGGTLDPPKDQITDYGAQAFPPFNTALRGLTVPVIFGTMRVSSNVVLQSDYQIIRQDSKQGGKGGGSGPPAPQQVNVSYIYKLDMAYHFGFVPKPVSLLTIWNGGSKLSSEIITRIDTGADAFTSAYLLQNNQGSGLTFDSAKFFTGLTQETGTWGPLTTLAGAGMNWPGTSWIGFENLNLGNSPSIPQLSFEIGPGAQSEIVNSPSFNWRYANDVYYLGLDGHNHLWAMDATSIYCINYTTGALVASYTTASLNTLFQAQLGWSLPSGNGCTATYLTSDGQRLIHTGAQQTFPSHRYWYSIKPESDGTLTLMGGIYHSVGSFYESVGSVSVLRGLGKARNDEGCILHFHGVNGNGFCFGPSAVQIEGLSPQKTGGTYGTPTWDFYFGNAPFHNAAFGNLPYSAEVLWEADLITFEPLNNYLYYFFGRSWVNTPPGGTWVADTLKPGHPNGALVRVYIGPSLVDFIPISGGGVDTTIVMDDPEILDGIFRDSAGTTYTYFTDDNRDYSTGAVALTATGNASYHTSPYVKYMDDGKIIVIFHQIYSQDQATYIAGENYTVKVRFRVYSFNPVTMEFSELSLAKGHIGTLTSLGFSTPVTLFSNLITAPHLQLLISRTELITFLKTGGGPTSIDAFQRVLFGSIDFGNGNDEYPPYIIKEILTNEMFGLYPGADIIDTDSYTTAMLYCQNNDIKVSTIYKNDARAWDLIQMLLTLYDGFLVIDATAGKIKFKFMETNNVSVRTIDNDHLVRTDPDSPPVVTTPGARQDTYNSIRVQYIDRGLDYKVNEVEDGDEVDQDINGLRQREFPAQFVMTEALAWKIANKSLWNNLYVRDTHLFHLGWKDADLEPGDVITLVDSFTTLRQVVQINKWEEVQRGIFQVNATQLLTGIPGVDVSNVTSAQWDLFNNSGVSSGYNVSSPTGTSSFEMVEAGYFRAYELPPEYEADNVAKVYVGWAPQGNAAAANLYVSNDGAAYSLAGQITPYMITGKVLTALDGNTKNPFNEGVEFVLYPTNSWSAESAYFTRNAAFNDVDINAMHNGFGLFYVGSEMISLYNLTLVDQNRYRAKRAYRGWGGTPIQDHSSGSPFWRHSVGAFTIPFNSDKIGNTFYYKVAPVGFDGVEANVSSIDAQQYTIKGTFFKPNETPAVEVNSKRGGGRFAVGSGQDVAFNWRSGARLAGFGYGGAGRNPGYWGGFASDTSTISWLVNVVGSGSVVVRSTVVTTPNFTYTNSMNAADNGQWRNNCAFTFTARNIYGNSHRTSVISLEVF